MEQFFGSLIGAVLGMIVSRRKHVWPAQRHKQAKGQTMLINHLRIIQDIEERLQEVINNPAKISAHASRLSEVEREEKVISTIDSDLLRAMWVVMIEALGCSRMEMAQISMSMSDIDAQEHKYKGFYLDDLNDVVGEMFWAELKLEVNFTQGNGLAIGVREGWKVVSFKERPEMPIALRALLGPIGGQ